MGVYLWKERLPSTYQEVEYIQSSGSQYIDTGFAPDGNTELEFDFVPTSTSGYQGYFGSDYDWDNTAFQSYNDRLFSYGNQYGASGTYFVANTRYLLEFKSGTVRLNGNTIRTVSISTFTVPHSALICAVYREAYNGISNYGSEKVYGLKLWDNGTLVRDFVPCYRKSDSVIGMYDLVNNQFYTNSGSGTFTKGQNINYVEHELKNAYIGEYGWQPGANTIAYYPLTSTTTVNDMSGNNKNLTNNGVTFGTYNGVDCANMTTNVYAYSTDIPLPSGANPRTISFWFYDTSSVNDTYWCAYGSHSTGRFFAPRINNSRYSFMGYARDFDTSTTVSTGVWKLITVTYDGTTVKYYLNGGDIGSSNLSLDTTAVGSTRKFVIGCRLDSSANPNQYVTGYMSNMILEDKARTAQEVSDYYDQTKAIYGL